MREVTDKQRVRMLMEALARHAPGPTRVFFAGGATAVLMAWRKTTIDVDLRIEPESDQILRAIPALKEDLRINIEFATPLDFIPVATTWRERSPFIAAVGQVSYHHFDLYAQALAKVERGHVQDVADLRKMVETSVIEPSEAIIYFESVEDELYKYPALDPKAYRESVMTFFSTDQT